MDTHITFQISGVKFNAERWYLRCTFNFAYLISIINYFKYESKLYYFVRFSILFSYFFTYLNCCGIIVTDKTCVTVRIFMYNKILTKYASNRKTF